MSYPVHRDPTGRSGFFQRLAGKVREGRARRRLGAAVCLALLLGTTAAQALPANKGALLLLAARDAQGKLIGTGTGFVFDPEGRVLTNYHVLVDAARVEGVFPNGERVRVLGIHALDRVRDYSILQLEKGFYSTLELGDATALKEFDYTSALGFPSQALQSENGLLSGTLIQTYGFVLGIHPQAFPDFSFIYTSTPFDPGFSGGPLLDRNNKVVGLATLEGRAINLALPINEVNPLSHKPGKLKTFAELLKEDKDAKEALYYKGNFALYAEGEPRRAVRLLQQVLERDPDFHPARYDLAVAYRGLGQEDRAIAEYQTLLAKHPRFPEALSNLGGQFFRKGKTEQAIEYFKKAIAVYPNFVQALSNLGAAYNKLGRHQEALPYLKKAAALDPEFAVVHFNLGNAYFGLGRFDEAEKAFSTAVRYGVDFLSLHWKLVEIHLKKGDRAGAIRELKLILEIDPLNKEASDRLIELQTGKF